MPFDLQSGCRTVPDLLTADVVAAATEVISIAGCRRSAGEEAPPLRRRTASRAGAAPERSCRGQSGSSGLQRHSHVPMPPETTISAPRAGVISLAA
jgi:hypothetical protein